MKEKLEKIYDHKSSEEELYKFWEGNDFFKSHINNKKKSYTIAMPPPNITGQLHMGHALDNTIQDILIRFKRMKGYEALWIPGTDHAAIATEAKIVEQMRREGLTKEGLGRKEFLERAWEWKEEYGTKITRQIRKLGASCDWSRNRFTMDAGCSKAVKEFFVSLYEKGLIYRGERIVNWCPKCLTSISDAEVDFKEKDSGFWHIRYKLSDGSGFVEIATTRPETLLGDTALAVNPDDHRYNKLVGKNAVVPLINRKIPIIADNYVEKDFGTGIVKITPAHDPNDFEVGQRHNLDIINIMDEKAVMNENAGKYTGIDRDQARIKIIKDLEQHSFIVKKESIKNNVGTCYRCADIIEPRISTQWFVKMKPLAEPSIDIVKRGKIKFIPERFSKVYYHWMENVKDWCISRQLWWGHRIPAWYCSKCGHITVSRVDVKQCERCGSYEIAQDEDTLDTWFSSALWPLSILGWPDKTPDFDYYYPTDTLVTGYDIIFFWVARMIFVSKELLGKEPFKNVFIHGLVRDERGRKMSKSLENGIDPLKVVEEYGADALRFTLVTGNSPGNDLRFSDEKIMSSRSFANKIWNAARFIHMNLSKMEIENKLPENPNKIEQWIISRFNYVVKEVTNNIEKFELGLALKKLYDFIWDEFCDWYIEFAKIEMKENPSRREETLSVLVYIISNTMKLLHPFMPYITEKIWLSFPHEGKSIMVSDYPVYKSDLCYNDAEEEIKSIMEVIRHIRNRRSEVNVPSNKKLTVYISEQNDVDILLYSNFIRSLASIKSIEINNFPDISKCVAIVTNKTKMYIPMDELVDKEAEVLRLEKDLNSTLLLFNKIKLQLKNENFISRAPKNVVDGTKDNALKLEQKIKKLKDEIKLLK